MPPRGMIFLFQSLPALAAHPLGGVPGRGWVGAGGRGCSPGCGGSFAFAALILTSCLCRGPGARKGEAIA